MLHRTITPLVSMAVLFLIVIVISPSICRPLSRRATLPQPSLSLHRFFRRSPSTLASSSHRRRSVDDNSENPFPLLAPISSDAEDSVNLRRSIDTDSGEPQEEDLSEESIDQVEAEAEKNWNEFVASSPDEDTDLYPDSFTQDGDSDSSCSEEADASDNAPRTSTSSAPSNKNTQVNSLTSQDGASSKPQKSKHSGSHKQQDGEADKQKETEAAKQKEADAAQQKEAEAAKRKEAEANKAKEAEYAKQQEADDAQEKQGEADKQKKAEQGKKKAEEDKEKKTEEAEAAKAKQEADQAKAAEDATKKEAAQPPTSRDSYQATDVKPIPGTSVTTGTVHKDHKDDSYSTPSPESHSGDATYYDPGLGSCGLTNGSGDMIVAVSKLLYDSFPSQGGNPNTNEVCGKRIRATYKGKSCEVTVVDRCEACAHDDLDFTITAFEKLGSQDEGRLHGMTWTFI